MYVTSRFMILKLGIHITTYQHNNFVQIASGNKCIRNRRRGIRKKTEDDEQNLKSEAYSVSDDLHTSVYDRSCENVAIFLYYHSRIYLRTKF